jgi:hypothetical protein
MDTTTAETISAQLSDDGQRFETADGWTLPELCRQAAAILSRDEKRQLVRYGFADGSSIIASGAAWDLGVGDCFCWAGEPDPQCSHGIDTTEPSRTTTFSTANPFRREP